MLPLLLSGNWQNKEKIMAYQVIAVIGAGGKTTALPLLAEQSGKRSILITTTTHIYPMEGSLIDPSKEELKEALSGTVCAGSRAREGKLGILPPDVLEMGLKTGELVIYEGDGSRHHPLKLHRENEPVILPQTTHCLIMAGLSALGLRAEDAVHRFDLKWEPGRIVGVEELAYCVLETAAASGLPKSKIRVFFNQADVLEDLSPAEKAAEILRGQGLKTKIGSLQEDADCLYDWVTEG